MFLIVLLFAAHLLDSTIAWGGDAHREITRTALEFVANDRPTLRYIRDHFGGPQSLIHASTWADSKEAAIKYPGSEDLHFSNTPWRDCRAFNMTTDCGFGGSGECIVTGIADMALVAADPSRDKTDREEALKFLIHLFADIHQPLHTGFADDNGGGNIHPKISDEIGTFEEMSLHQLWDYGLLEANVTLDHEPFELYMPDMVSVPSSFESREELIEFASLLATESSTLLTCNVAYRNEAHHFIRSRDVLSLDYILSRREVAQQRVAIAGIRLGEFLVSLSRTFVQRRESVAPVSVTPAALTSTNRFAILAVELEPDDLVEESAFVIAASVSKKSKTSSPSKGKISSPPKPSDMAGLDDLLPEAPPIFIGRADIRDIVMVKRNERYVLTCTRFVEADKGDEYEVFHASSFRVRFTKNKRRTDPILIFADLDCFGPSLTLDDFLRALYHLSGIAGSMMPSRGDVATVTRFRSEDALDISPIAGEYSQRVEQGIAAGRWVRGWSPLYDEDNPAQIAYLSYLRNRHVDELELIIRRAAVLNISVDQLWDRDFYTKLSSILVYRFGELQVVIHRDTLTNPVLFEFKFAMVNCVSRSGGGEFSKNPFFLTLIDVNIFFGYPTPRIIKGLSALVTKQGANPDPVFTQRPTFLFELEDIDKVLSGRGRGRANTFKVIKGYYMYPSILSETMSFIEWTTKPYQFDPVIE